MNNECIFCDIINGKSSSNKIYEDEDVIALLDIDPINNGHILVVPKLHKLDIDDLDGHVMILQSKILTKFYLN